MNTFVDNADIGTNNFAQASSTDNGQQQVRVDGQLQAQISGMEKRMVDKDAHISTVESENLSLREQMADTQAKLEKMGSIEDALLRMEETNQHANNQDTALDEDALIKRTLQAMDTNRLQKTAEQNFQDVSTELSKTYGADNVDTKVRAVAAENGLTFDDMIELSRKSPNAVYRMAGLNVPQSIQGSPTRSTTSAYEEADNLSVKENRLAEFSKLRKENPREYWKADTQKEFRKLFN